MSAFFLSLHRRSFQSKINLGLALIIICFGLLLGAINYAVSSRAVLREALMRGEMLSMNLSARSTESILSMNFLRLTNLVTEIVDRDDRNDLVYAFILDRHGQVLAHTFRDGFPVALLHVNPVEDHQPFGMRFLDTGRERLYDFAAPVMVGSTRVGTVRLALSHTTIKAAIDRLMWINLAATIGATFLALFVGSLFARTVTRRINALRHSAEQVVKGNLDVQISPAPDRNCWEIMNCTEQRCPAHEDRLRRCWYVAGTFCPDCSAGNFPDKLDDCRNCTVYCRNSGDEIQSLAESFDFMALTLKNHIEELRRSEGNLARQKQLLNTILDVTPDMVTLQDVELIYLAVNKAFCRHVGREESEIVGSTDFDIFSDEQADRNYHEDMQILLTRQPLSKEIMTRGSKGKKWHHVVKVPVEENDRVIGLLTTARDITVVKQYQEKLIHSQKMEDLGRLAGGVAHEINTPLSIILGYSQLLLKDFPPDDPVAQDIEIIEKQAQVCRKIVADLLSFSRTTEQAALPMDINASLREVADLVEHIFRQNRIVINLHLDDRIPPVSGDKERLKQVWMNLFNNAADAIGMDGCISVTSKLCAHRRRLVVAVADTGGGVDENDLDKIFEPFFTTKPVDKGTGLGLSVTFGIIKDHGGRISAISPVPSEYMDVSPACTGESGPGTVFFVELPLEGNELPPDECIEIPKKET
ncbi:ATP-binding protein [Desulfonatronum thioautotrophicum]|uniref:ATP-binding protein n=1 Tax=Desulfonatronum thioautotrophicum TaxID=617001 RepID=UPI0005EAD65C|nr:ATP-binding protein [Desulfonatronum thioautotrophicum]